MLTAHERRVLYLLRKLGGNAKRSELTQQMHRLSATERDQAFANCEELGLILSAKTPTPRGSTGGQGGTRYWLTEYGTDCVATLIERGEMADPNKKTGNGGNTCDT